MEVIFENITKVGFSQLKHVAGHDELRPVMMGVYVDFKNQKLVATDARILMMYPIKITQNNSDLNGKILPVRFFNHLKYMQDIPTESKRIVDLKYVLTDEFAEVYWLNDLVFRCRYIEGFYPNYQAVINDSEDKLEGLDGIGMDFKMLKRVCDALPLTNKQCKFKFFGRNKHIIFQASEFDHEPIKGLIMPTLL